MIFMGQIFARIELISATDLVNARRHLIGEEEIKRIHVNMLVDTGSYEMCINENIKDFLDLPAMGKKRWRLANEETIELDMVGPIEVRFANRRCTMDAVVLPGDSEPLLGAIPMEALDVLIHPLRQELIINPEHPEGDMRRIPTLKSAQPKLYLDGKEGFYVLGHPVIDGDSFSPFAVVRVPLE
jgi:clan AA aspartic protease